MDIIYSIQAKSLICVWPHGFGGEAVGGFGGKMILKMIVILVGVLLLQAGYFDLRYMRIPNWIPLAVFGLFLVFLVAQHFSGLAEKPLPVWSSLGVGFAVFAAFTILFALNLVGGGDVKLISAIAFWAGKEQILEFLLLTAFAGGALAVLVMLWRRYTGTDSIFFSTTELPAHAKGRAKSVAVNKTKRKTTYIPYGIAISLGGLFVVNNILTFLLS